MWVVSQSVNVSPTLRGGRNAVYAASGLGASGRIPTVTRQSGAARWSSFCPSPSQATNSGSLSNSSTPLISCSMFLKTPPTCKSHRGARPVPRPYRVICERRPLYVCRAGRRGPPPARASSRLIAFLPFVRPGEVRAIRSGLERVAGPKFVRTPAGSSCGVSGDVTLSSGMFLEQSGAAGQARQEASPSARPRAPGPHAVPKARPRSRPRRRLATAAGPCR
jgi:hypothetical protein